MINDPPFMLAQWVEILPQHTRHKAQADAVTAPDSFNLCFAPKQAAVQLCAAMRSSRSTISAKGNSCESVVFCKNQD